MNIIKQFRESPAKRNYIVELFAFLPFLSMIATGLVMLRFHVGQNDSLLVLGISKADWLLCHKICAITALVFIVWHLLQHTEWLKKLFKLQLRNRFRFLNTTLFLVFLFTVTTSGFSWLVFKDTIIGYGLRGIHSKLGFTMMILFVFHLKNYLGWIIRMTNKVLIKN